MFTKQGAGDAVIGIDVFIGDGPAFLDGVRLAVLNLARDGLFVAPNAVLLGALPRVDCRDHAVSLWLCDERARIAQMMLAAAYVPRTLSQGCRPVRRAQRPSETAPCPSAPSVMATNSSPSIAVRASRPRRTRG